MGWRLYRRMEVYNGMTSIQMGGGRRWDDHILVVILVLRSTCFTKFYSDERWKNKDKHAKTVLHSVHLTLLRPHGCSECQHFSFFKKVWRLWQRKAHFPSSVQQEITYNILHTFTTFLQRASRFDDLFLSIWTEAEDVAAGSAFVSYSDLHHHR